MRTYGRSKGVVALTESAEDRTAEGGRSGGGASDGRTTSAVGLLAYLAESCVAAGHYVLGLSTTGQSVSPAASSKGFVRAVHTLSLSNGPRGRSPSPCTGEAPLASSSLLTTSSSAA